VTLVVGVDVGNSKTHVAAAGPDGAIVGVATGTGWVSGSLTDETVVGHVLALVERAAGRRGGFEAATVAMAGLDLPEQARTMAERLAPLAAAGRLGVLNDTFALLRAGSAGGEGVAVVAGAGINCVGVRGDRTVRYHSQGRLSGDWGGGYDLGAEALAMACRAEDGRGAATVLDRLVPRHFGLERPLQVTEALLTGSLGPERLLELCPRVYAAAADGDAVALGLVHRLADEVAAFVTATAERLGWSEGPLPVVLGGGLLRSRDPRLLARVRAGLGDLAERAEIAVCDVPPVTGAVLLALDLAGRLAPSAASLGADVARLLGD
jgi:N-acetylglucosamine kinase-like BadF-type ATPase